LEILSVIRLSFHDGIESAIPSPLNYLTIKSTIEYVKDQFQTKRRQSSGTTGTC
jgi:hypothetical protein